MIYRFREFEADLARRILTRAGEEVHLRRRAFDVLARLLENRERLVTREELFAEVWRDTVVTDDVLAGVVAELRKALQDDSRTPLYIKTMPRSGYRFIAPVEAEPVPKAPDAGPAESPAARASSGTAGPGTRADFGWRIPLTILAALVCGAAFGIVLSPSIARTALKNTAPADPELPWFEAAWWKLDEGSGTKVADAIASLRATLPAGVSWTKGISGSGLLFSGAPALLRGSGKGVLPQADRPRTLTAWMKASSTNGDATPVFAEGDANPDLPSTFSLAMNEGGRPAFGFSHFALNGKRRVDDGAWHQLAGVYQGGSTRKMTLFVDGTEEATAARLVTPAASADPQWAIGSGPAGGTSFRGAVDDVRFFDRALRPDEIKGMYQCLAGGDDLERPGGASYFFASISGDNIELLHKRAGDHSVGIRNTGLDMAGAMVVKRAAGCSLGSVHGADLGQDLNIAVEVRVPPGPGGAVTEAGPYFRSRRANPGDGIVGGTSAGFWVRLDSTGQVSVRRLMPFAAIGFSPPIAGFDADKLHRIEAAVQGNLLEVALDGQVLTFDAAAERQSALRLEPLWETAFPKGENGGSVGVEFSCARNRGLAGGQEARNLRITAYHPLRAGRVP